VPEQAQLGLAVCRERAVSVEVVLLDVEEQRGVGREQHGVLGLEARHLADDGHVLGELADERRQRRAHVARHRDGKLRGAPDRPQ
jgi:hypothetical protein